MRIAHHDLREKVLIVAEIGNNHEGDFALAKRLVVAAAEAGADAVKFQTIVPEEIVGPEQEARLAKLRQWQFGAAQFGELAAVAAEAGVLFLSTPFALSAVSWLAPLVPAWKVASGDNTFRPLLDRLAATGKPIVLSTGLTALPELRGIVGYLRDRWLHHRQPAQLALLQCTCAYPTPPEQANLAAIRTLAEAFRCPVGYSDHTLGLDAAVLAVAAGARIVEKHFTIDKHYSDFRDHQLSADPVDLKELVRCIREAETLLGDGRKLVQPAEAGNVTPVRRGIAVRRDLPAGHRLTWDDLAWLRPGEGLPPGREAWLAGRPLRHAVKQGHHLLPSDVD